MCSMRARAGVYGWGPPGVWQSISKPQVWLVLFAFLSWGSQQDVAYTLRALKILGAQGPRHPSPLLNRQADTFCRTVSPPPRRPQP